MLNLLSSFLSFLICDSTSVQIGVNRHLFTRHCIECESCSYLRYSLRTFVDNDKLDQYQNNEYNRTNDHITATNETSERCNDITRISRQKNQTGGRYIQ